MKALKKLTCLLFACLLCVGLLSVSPTIAYAVDWPQVTNFSIASKNISCTDSKGNTFSVSSKENTVYTKDVTSANNAKKAESITITRYKVENYAELEADSAGNNIAGEIRLYPESEVAGTSVYIWQNSWQATTTKGSTAACKKGKTTYSIGLKSDANYINTNTFYVEKDGTKYYYKVMLINPFKITAVGEPFRISETAAEIKINTKEIASCYYAVVESGGAAPDIDTSGEGIAMRLGDNSIPITLTAGAKDVYIVGKNADGTVSEPVKVSVGADVSAGQVVLYLSDNGAPSFVKAEVNGTAASYSNVSNVITISNLHYNDQVKIWLQPNDTAKCISEVSLVSEANTTNAMALYYSPTVDSAENSFIFTMPATASVRSAICFNGDENIGGWLRYIDAPVPKYNLTGAVSKLWEDQAEGASNAKGTITFTDESGAAITVAERGSKVIAKAEPMAGSSWYEFRFVKWMDESGITISEENRTNPNLEFEMGDSDVHLFAEFENVGTTVSWGTNITIDKDMAVVVCNGNSSVNPYIYKTNSTAGFYISGTGWQDGYVFEGWTFLRDGTAIPESELKLTEYGTSGEVGYHSRVDLTISGSNIKATANFRARAFAAVNTTVNDSAMGTATAAVGDGTPAENLATVFEGQTVTLTATPGNQRYLLESWEVKDADDTTITVTADAQDANKATFTMPSTGKDITAKAIFKVDPDKASSECTLSEVALNIDGATVSRQGTRVTITIPADADISSLSAAKLTLKVSDYADVIKSGDTEAKDWASGQPCGMTLDTETIFTVRSEKCRIGKDDSAKADYTITITKAKSSEKAITAAVLLNGSTTIATGTLSGTTWTITLPEDIDKALLQKIGTSTDVFMQIDYTGVSVKQDEGYDDASAADNMKWSSGNVMCGISPNSSATFTVTAEDGSTKEYTVEIKYTAPNAPTLSAGSATRTGKTSATVKFTSNEAGTYFYKVVEHGAAAPTVDTSKNGTAAVKGENAITLSNLTEDARDIYIVVKNASGVTSAPLKVDIPAYGDSTVPDTGNFTVSVTAPKGGTLTTNRTKANKGDEIIVTVTPDSGYQMVEGSLTYSLAVAGGETVKITGNRFTMPASNVTITCKWETATVSAKGITAFTINGVSAAVNNTTNVITITLPRGTDVTKLTPVISTSGVKSLSPASGKTVDFTNSVTYTATMDDGSTKTYTVTVYVDKGSLADQFWDKLTDFYNQTPWWQYAEHQQSTKKYPKYW